MAERPLVILYGRPGCHLCSQARSLLDALRLKLGFDVDEIDIESDDALLARYVFEIPVVAIDGVEIARAPIVAARLEDALRERLRD